MNCDSTHNRTIKERMDWCLTFQLQDLPIDGVLESFCCTIPGNPCLPIGILVPATICRRGTLSMNLFHNLKHKGLCDHSIEMGYMV